MEEVEAVQVALRAVQQVGDGAMEQLERSTMALVSRHQAVKADLAAERETRQRAETVARDASNIAETNRRLGLNYLARAEQAERERDDLRREVLGHPVVTAIARERDELAARLDTMTAIMSRGTDDLLADRVARERAEADNAEWKRLALDVCDRWQGPFEAGGFRKRYCGATCAPCLYCDEKSPRHLAALALRDATESDHPGAALLEELRALREVAESARLVLSRRSLRGDVVDEALGFLGESIRAADALTPPRMPRASERPGRKAAEALAGVVSRGRDKATLHRVGFTAFDKRGAHVAEVVDAVAEHILGTAGDVADALKGGG